jgi:hypothetical protein
MEGKGFMVSLALVVFMIPVMQALYCYQCEVSVDKVTGEYNKGGNIQRGCDNTTIVRSNTTFESKMCNAANPMFRRDNPDTELKCIKMLVTSEKNVRTIRQCRWVEKGNPQGCRSLTEKELNFEKGSGHDADKFAIQMCECEGDSCNPAPAMEVSFISIVLFGAVAKLLVA